MLFLHLPPITNLNLTDMNKKELRAYIAAQKQEIPLTTRRELSAPILRRLASHPKFIEAKTVLLYYSKEDEVDTRDFVTYWSTRKNVLLPVVKNGEIELRLFSAERGLAEGTFGILEPIGEAFTDYHNIDLIVAPGIAFDSKGMRLGRGRGYYDRMFNRMKDANIYKIGICFDFQKVNEIESMSYDVGMDEIL